MQKNLNGKETYIILRITVLLYCRYYAKYRHYYDDVRKKVMRLIMVPVEGDIMTDELMTFKEAAEFLKVSEKTLMRLLAEESVPARKIGTKWRFSKEALLRWLSEGDSKNYAKNANMDDVSDVD